MAVYAKIVHFFEVIERGSLVKVIHYFAHNDCRTSVSYELYNNKKSCFKPYVTSYDFIYHENVMGLF